MLKLIDIISARQRIAPYILTTPIEPSPELGSRVYMKLENVHILHSFKIRGALNAILAQQRRARYNGVVTSSAGNHGLGLVYAASLLGIEATVVMPEHAPQRKIDGVKQYGANVVLHGRIYDDAELYARQLEKNEDKLFVSPYNDPYVVAGQGTIALELIEQLAGVEQILIPVGGGGLISGVGLAIKAIDPDIKITGVQSEATPAMYNYLNGTDLSQDPSTLADGLSGDIEAGSITIDLCREVCDELLLVSEDDLASAIQWMFRVHGWVIEGSAACGIAALQTSIVSSDAKTALIITGGNIDADTFLRLMITR
ncbi:MAG: threonine/serine dehydratase [Chloroflexi bacterium]|nr:threonine/serine dehydratase [Chloroflexota bacterium]